MNPIKVATLFSGYDSQCLALERIGIPYDLVLWSEIDKFAIQAHNALFPQYVARNAGDVCKIDWHNAPDIDLLTYSSPCQDFSNVGQRKGGDKGSGTRSSLLWEVQKAIEVKRPKYLLFENVAAIASKNFIKMFNSWQLTLEQYGYTNYTEILNARDYGVPQSRKRVFMVSILHPMQPFVFPKPQPLTRLMKDLFEDTIDEKYYCSQKFIECMHRYNQRKLERGYDCHFTTTDGNSIAKTITTCPATRPLGNYIRTDNRIRRTTPRECFRLMGVSDKDIDILQSAGISETQQYKLAGNSIVVDVLAAIFRQLLSDKKETQKQLVLF